MARRAIVIRLEANTERLSQRRFEIENPFGYVMSNRPELLIHALTIIKAFQVAKDIPEMPVPWPSFERWSRVARDPLIWLGMADPCDTQSESDDETASVAAVFATLAGHFGDREFTSNDVTRVVGSILDADGELINALQESGCSEPTRPKDVGYWLRREGGTINRGLKLVNNRANNGRGAKWRFVRVEESLT